MPFFAVHYTYTEDSAALDVSRQKHRDYLRQLAKVGALRASGPYVGTTPGTALLLFKADSMDTVQETLHRDPFQVDGLVTSYTITEWNPVIGVFAGEAG